MQKKPSEVKVTLEATKVATPTVHWLGNETQSSKMSREKLNQHPDIEAL